MVTATHNIPTVPTNYSNLENKTLRSSVNFKKMQFSTVQPVFKLELNHKVTPGVVTIAKFDGTHPCLTASAGFDKVCTSPTNSWLLFSCGVNR